MRMRFLTTASVAALAALVAGCDTSTSPEVAGLAPATGAVTVLDQLVISPASVQMGIAQTSQLSTNTPPELTGALEWTTSAPSIATVNQAGLVTALNFGTAIITVRYVTDPANRATSTVRVNQP